MKLQAVYTTDLLDPADGAIRLVSGGRFSHVLVLFTLTEEELRSVSFLAAPEMVKGLSPWPDGLYRVYFESLMARDAFTKKTGVRGPYDFRRVEKWLNGGRRRILGKVRQTRRVEIQNLPWLSDEEIRRAFVTAAKAVRRIRYAAMQLLHNWRGLRFKVGIPVRARTRDKWTCVELVVRILPAWFLVEFLELGETLFDEYAPAGKHGFGLYEMIDRARIEILARRVVDGALNRR